MTDAAHRACQRCGATLPAEARFCGRCGREQPVIDRDAAARRVRLDARRQQRVSEQLWRRFAPALVLWVLLLAVNGLLGLASHVGDVSSPAVDLLVTAVSAAIVLAFCCQDRRQLLPLLRTSGLDDRTWWLPVVMLAVIPAFMESYFWALSALGLATESYLEAFVLHDWPLWVAFVLGSVCPGVFEELAFRGFLFGRLQPVMGTRDALLVQAAMFSVLHMSPLVFVSHFVMGLLLGLVRVRTGSLWPGIVLHMLWNGWVLFEEAVAR